MDTKRVRRWRLSRGTAAANGDLAAVQAHVAQGAELDQPEFVYGVTPLGWAVIAEQHDIIDYLLEAGADPGARFDDGNTALHAAAFFGRAEAARQLLDAGAEVDARKLNGETPMDVMAHNRSTTEFIARTTS